MNEKDRIALIFEQTDEVRVSYPHLHLVLPEANCLKGALCANASHPDFDDVFYMEYEISIEIPSSYPDDLPRTRELAGHIEKSFHTNWDGTLCLGAPFALRRSFMQNPSLLGYIENCLLQYLYAYEFNKKYGSMPFGELTHGTQGLIEYYLELFETDDYWKALELLRILADDNYRGHHPCPCGSGLILRNCHGELLIRRRELQLPKDHVVEFLFFAKAINLRGHKIPEKLFSTRAIKMYNRKRLIGLGFFSDIKTEAPRP